MGYSYSEYDFPKMCFNGAKTWCVHKKSRNIYFIFVVIISSFITPYYYELRQLGWFSQKRIVVEASGMQTYIGEIAGFVEDPSDPSIPPMLVKLNTPSSVDYYISFNRQRDFNIGTKEGGNMVLITSQGGEGTSYAQSSLEAKLSEGMSWTSPQNYEGKLFRVTVVSIGVRAKVEICWGVCVTSSPTRSPTQIPTERPTTALIVSYQESKPKSSHPAATPGIDTSQLTLEPNQISTLAPTVESNQPNLGPYYTNPNPTKAPINDNQLNVPTINPTLISSNFIQHSYHDESASCFYSASPILSLLSASLVIFFITLY